MRTPMYDHIIYVRPCLCDADVQGGQLQPAVGWMPQVCDRQVTANHAPFPFGRICFVVLVMRKGVKSSWSQSINQSINQSITQKNQSVSQSIVIFRLAYVIVITARTIKNVNYRRMSGNECRNRKVFKWCWNDCRVDALTMYSISRVVSEKIN